MKIKIPGAKRITDNFSRKSVDKILTWWWLLCTCPIVSLPRWNRIIISTFESLSQHCLLVKKDANCAPCFLTCRMKCLLYLALVAAAAEGQLLKSAKVIKYF